MLAVAEQKLGTAELTTVKKRLELGVNTAKEREAELRKKASGKKKGPNTAKVGGAIDTYDEAYDEAPAAVSAPAGGGGSGAGESEGGGTPSPFVKPKFKVEECVTGLLALSVSLSPAPARPPLTPRPAPPSLLPRSPPQGLYVVGSGPCAASIAGGAEGENCQLIFCLFYERVWKKREGGSRQGK